MLDEQTRINAMVSYLFLSPFFLLAKSGTPLAHPFVRAHAKKGSLFLLFGAIVYGLLISLKPFLSFAFFGVNIFVILLSLLLTILLILLLLGAYRAYHGIEASDIHIGHMESMSEVRLASGNYSEEEKIRIISSFIPFLGIFIASRYPTLETQTGRKIGNFLTFLFLIFAGFVGKTDILVFLVTAVYIALIVVTGVYLFLEGKFLSLRVYDFIPTYKDFQANIKAGFFTLLDAIRVVLGKEKGANFTSLKEHFASSFIDGKDRVVEWIFLVIFTGVLTWYFGVQNPLLLILLFPFLTLILESKNPKSHTPIASLGSDMLTLFSHTKNHVNTLQKTEIEEKFTYQDQK